MSKDPCDNCPPSDSSGSRWNKSCFWYSQGNCFLTSLQPEMVYDILCRNPGAREGLINCADLDLCDSVIPEYLDFALNTEGLVDRQDVNDELQKRFVTTLSNAPEGLQAPIQYKTDKNGSKL